MTYIKQRQLLNLRDAVRPNNVVLIYGPRRVGKTTLIAEYLKSVSEPYLLVNGEDPSVRKILSSDKISSLRSFVGNHKLFVIDEAQHIDNIGLNLKIMVDNIPNLKIIATGSSSFNLAQKVGAPLLGRATILHLYPLAQLEIKEEENLAETHANLERRLIYGSYPSVITEEDNAVARSYLEQIVGSYLYKDVAELGEVRKPKTLTKLLELLAFQIGKEVSLTELGAQLELHKDTVAKYLYYLEESFVIYSLRGFSRNLRKEVSKQDKYYFYDIGIRNALINNFNHISLRTDVGELWENYLFMERIKRGEYLGTRSNYYFWRTYDQKEIDLVEEREGKLFGYEFKYSPKKLPKAPKDWLGTYSNANYEVITPENYLDFIT